MIPPAVRRQVPAGFRLTSATICMPSQRRLLSASKLYTKPSNSLCNPAQHSIEQTYRPIDLPATRRLASTTSSTYPPEPISPPGAPQPPKEPSRLRALGKNVAAAFGATMFLVGAGVVGFFLYDASTYSDEYVAGDINVSQLALSPRRGGPKNLPICDVLLDDDENPAQQSRKSKPHLVILGTGWGSVALLKDINPDDYHITVVSPRNYFLFTPMLPSATVGTLEVRSLVESVRRIVSNVGGHYLRAHAENVEFSERLVELSQADREGNEQRFYLPYDKLVVAVGSKTNTHGVNGLEHSLFLKDVNDARKIRNRVLSNLELACLPTTTDEERKRLLSFVICGGGPTGVEFAAELFDLLNEDLARNFPKILRNEVSVHLIQSRGHILNTYDEKVSEYAEERFARDQVNVMTNSRVKQIFKDKVVFTQKMADGTVVEKELPTGFCLWSTGVSQSNFCKRIAEQLPEQKNRLALETDSHLRVIGTPLGEVYAIGDCSTVQNNIADRIAMFVSGLAQKRGQDPNTVQLQFSQWKILAEDVKRRFPQAGTHLKHLDKLFEEFDMDKSGTLDIEELRALMKQIDSKLTSLPATAQRANQQGQYLARKFNKLARKINTLHAHDIHDNDVDAAVYKAFEYHHLGSLAYVGNSAVFDFGKGWNFTGGLWAVYAWRSAYFAQSVSMRTRILMAMDWAKRALFGRDMVSLQ
ncbi:hypothetical protein TD95_003000 [Thielaviopsis punctulata]|uniref:EF-hand domain-containing protein n=1 Tax=Thielaviopsis punctulata TaxID=72032 RepID=A0A0F4ZEI6_9PEZI|nr:hypothetical protein TD95_003000 [Thielaviopsis punctulata]